MFKKLKDKLEEEFKQAPLKFPVSVQQLAQVISPSPSVNLLNDNNASTSFSYSSEMPNVSTDFFSIGEDDVSDHQDGVTKTPLTLQNVDLNAASPSNMTHNTSRSRRSSLSSVTSEASSLFPIYESGQNQNFLQSDLDSEMEDGISYQLDRFSNEEVYQTFKKVLNRYNKYKGKYSELLKHYKELQHENFKTKNVLQESQDKALRRITELREQCQLEQKAKAHLEESLRNDVEERDHIIETLKTKISLLSNGDKIGHLIDIESQHEANLPNADSQEVELRNLKFQNEDLQKKVEKLKKIKETACHLIHRCDTTINEATADIQNDNLKRKMSELKFEIQKMKSENESLSHLLSRNILTDEDKRSQESEVGNGSFLMYSGSNDSIRGPEEEESSKADDKDIKIEKLNNLLLKCKEKINGLHLEIKSKDLIIEDKQKLMKELKEKLDLMKAKEEESALTTAENKKAIHEELDAKENEIKALTQKLKNKENEYSKEKNEISKLHEEEIRELTMKFTKEIKIKNDENQKLIKNLKAKEIVSESLDKLKTLEDGFSDFLEILKNKSSAYEALATLKTNEIESAQQKLEGRLAVARNNIAKLLEKNSIRSNETILKSEMMKGNENIESNFSIKNLTAGNSENFHIVEKLEADVMNLSKKVEVTMRELEESNQQKRIEEEEKNEWKKRCIEIEKQCQKLQEDFKEKAEKNTALGRELSNRNEQIKRVETEKEMLQNASREKIETEFKLKECMEKYNKLEAENRTLQNDLVEKCGKLLKDLNESKEKIKTLEEEKNTKTSELEALKKKHSTEEKKKTKEIQDLKKEWETLKADTCLTQQRFTDELEKLKYESETLKTAAAETTEIRKELEKKEEETNRLRNDLSALEEEKQMVLKKLELVKREKIQDGEANERLKNELEALRGNLKGELKEKEEKSILVDKLTQECNLLLTEIENLKKTHSNSENKLGKELKMIREECAIHRNTLDSLKEQFEENQKVMNAKEIELEDTKKNLAALKEENESLKEMQDRKESLSSDEEKVKNELKENEKTMLEMKENIFKLTNDMNEAFGELQVKEKELETLRNSLKMLQNELANKEKEFAEERARLASENENKLNILKNEIKYINTKHEEDIENFEENLNSEMKEANEKTAIAEKTSAELLDKLEKITCERDELKMAEEEKNLKIVEMENCLMALKTEMNDRFNATSQNDDQDAKHKEEIRKIITQYDKEVADRDEKIEELRAELEGEKEELTKKHGDEVKQIIIQYDSEIAQRDEEIDLLKSKVSDHEAVLEELNLIKKELKRTRIEMGDRKREEIEDDDETKESGSERVESMDDLKYRELLKKERENFEKEKEKAVRLEREIWETRLANAIKKYQKEGLERKSVSDGHRDGGDWSAGPTEEMNLESAIKASVSRSLESGSSPEILEKQLIKQADEMKELKKQYKKELMALKKISSNNQDWYFRCGGLDNDTEYEYLRNILYEYMMGREQLVLAKVLSAIVKFNEEQTHNVLEKEQQRQTLLGHLGLL